MAASVLGKRSRKTFEVEVAAAEVQLCKRRTRRTAPQIYNDENASPQDVQSSQTGIADATNSKQRSRKPQVRKASKIQRPSKIEARSSTIQPLIPLSTDNSFEEVTDENRPPEFDTPTTTRFQDVLQGKILITPRRRVPIGLTTVTPQSSRKSTPAHCKTSMYAEAKTLFAQSANAAMVGRESERLKIQNFISGSVTARTGGSLYISGPPGTGKSALMKEIFEAFASEAGIKGVFVNCVGIKSPKDIQHRLVQEFCANSNTLTASPKQILSRLFTGNTTNRTTRLVVLDELDSLLDSDCDVLYSLFDWSLSPTSNLVLIGIANALDLTDRFLPRLKDRNLKPQLLSFQPYTAEEISRVITSKLQSVQPVHMSSDFVPFMHPAAISLCSKKVAAQSGDLRKAFNLVRRAIEQVEMETVAKATYVSPTKQPLRDLVNEQRTYLPSPPASSPSEKSSDSPPALLATSVELIPRASIAHVAKVSSTIFNNSTTSRLTGLNLQQKAVLSSLVARENRESHRDPYTTPTKSRAPTVKDLFGKYVIMCQRDDCLLQPLKTTEFRDVVASLETLGLVQEYRGRASGILTPSQNPSRLAQNADSKQVVSGVSRKEMVESLSGPGADLLLRLFDE